VEPHSVNLKSRCYLGALRVLTDRFLHRPQREDIALLQQVLQDAQRTPPEDKQQFVKTINSLLRTMECRIRLPDGAFCVLCVKSGGGNGSYIQFQKSLQSCGGFASTPLRVVPVGRTRGYSGFVDLSAESPS
jgi:hypothetical protein